MSSTIISRPHVFERGDKVYLTTPLTLATPTEQQIEEFAFASAVRSAAPNENIGWLQGRYVEAGRPNLNNAMWLSDELALKSLTPMLMPVTVMHDPRTAVGTIADTKLINGDSANSRIDTALAIWRHRFPEVWDEAAHDMSRGQLMQSMECYAPWYSCSECSQQYIKLPDGAEKASWCDHLRGNSSSPGWRILQSVCFTGTGLIFGNRGGVGAYTDAHLDHFHDEIAEYHDRAHADSTYTPNRSSHMALVQIEESELAELRRERNEARTRVDTLQTESRELTTKVERAEAEKLAAETAKAAADIEVASLKAKAETAQLKDKRVSALGAGFMAKLGDTSKARLGELASTCSDEQWNAELAEREEWAGVKRDAQADPGAPGTQTAPTIAAAGSGFASEEVASFMSRAGQGGGSGAPQVHGPDGVTSVRQLARAFGKKPKTPAGTQG